MGFARLFSSPRVVQFLGKQTNIQQPRTTPQSPFHLMPLPSLPPNVTYPIIIISGALIIPYSDTLISMGHVRYLTDKLASWQSI